MNDEDKFLDEHHSRSIKNVCKLYNRLDHIKELLGYDDTKDIISNSLESLKKDFRHVLREISRNCPCSKDKKDKSE